MDNNPISSMQPGEQILCEIKRHPFGIIGIYVMASLVIIVMAVLAFVAAPALITDASHGEIIKYGGIAFIVVALITLVFVFIQQYIYWQNRWFLTTDSLTQVTQTGLFNRQSSQLSLGNLEDITAEQNGLLTHLFNFGVLRAETAGERSKFMFLYCPNPNYYAQQVLDAREKFQQQHPQG